MLVIEHSEASPGPRIMESLVFFWLQCDFVRRSPADSHPNRVRIGPENILAVGAVSVALILAARIVGHAVDFASGGAVIATLVGGSTISKIIASRMRARKTID
jgi:hypothetical protein